jgi:hypothetical protein
MPARKGTAIDREALHRYLYRRTDRMGRLLQLNQTALSEETGIGYAWLSQILTSFVKEGRMTVISGQKMCRKSFVVINPEEWHKTH